MKKKLLTLISLFFFILMVILYYLDLSIEVYYQIIRVIKNPDLLKENIGLIATIFSIIMYIKLRFIDTRLFTKLESTYGKQRFITALDTILELLKVINPEDLVKKVLMIDEMEIEMMESIESIKELIKNGNEEKKEEPVLDINKGEEKKLKKEIKSLLNLIDKRLELHYLSKSVTKDRIEISKIKDVFEENLIKSKRKKKKIDEFRDNEIKIGKKDLIKNFNTKK